MTTTENYGPIEWRYAYDTIKAAEMVPAGTVSKQSHNIGMRHGEPIIVAMDAMLQYALTYNVRFGSKLNNDYVLGPEWLQTMTGLRGLLNGDGAVAMGMNRNTDSKDNGACESIFWAAMEAAGFTEKDLN